MPLLENYVVLISFLLSDIIIGLVAELLLKTEQKGTKFRWTLSPFKPYLKKKKAITIAILQSSIAFALSLFISDWITAILLPRGLVIIPFSLIIFCLFYVFAIRLNTLSMYKFTNKEKGIVALIAIISTLWVLFWTFI